MDLKSILLYAVIISILVAMVLLLRRNKEKKRKLKLKSLNDLANAHNCAVTQYEFCGNISIGIDEASDFLFFIKSRYDEVSSFHINLSEIQKCRIINTSRSVNNNNSIYVVIDRLELAFEPTDKSKQQILLEFYNSAHDNLSLSGELQLIEKWSKIIDNRLHNKA